MSADSMHAAIERVLRRKSPFIQDFIDLTSSVKEAGCEVLEMEPRHFRSYVSGLKSFSAADRQQRPYLSEIVHVEFHRGCKQLFYKTSHFSHNLQECNFLRAKHDGSKAASLQKARGVSSTKKKGIIDNLVPLMDHHKRQFWFDFPEMMHLQ